MAVFWNMISRLSFIAAYASAITLFTSSDRATVGMDFNFTCITNDFFVTITRNDIDECALVHTNSDGSCIFLRDCNLNFTISCNFTTYTLTIPGSFDINTLHGSNWSCSGDFGADISNRVMLYVNVPITRLSIKSLSSGDDNPIKIVRGSRQTFTCSSDGGRPPSSIQWYISDTNITGDSKVQTYICNPGCNGKVMSSSALEYTGDNVDNGKKIYCTAVNVEGHYVRSHDIEIVILYEPMISSITDQIIQEGNTLTVISNIDASPVSMLVWWSRSNELSFRQDGTVLTIRDIHREFSGYYTCHAMNTLIPSGQALENRTSVKRFYVSVQYPPSVTIVPNYNPYILYERQQNIVFSCVIDANPSSNITYNWNYPNGSINGKFLTIPTVKRGKSGLYSCYATNSIGTSEITTKQLEIQLLSANKTVKTNTIGIWFGSSLAALIAIAFTGLFVFKYRKRQVPNGEENTNTRVYESTQNVQRDTSEAEQHLYNDIQVIESEVKSLKKEIDGSFNTYEDIWDVSNKKPDHVYQNMKISNKEENNHQKETAIYVNLELKPSTFT